MTPAKGYTEMKDSGSDWIGKIPATWDISKIGTLYTQRNEKVSDKDYPPLSVTMKGILPQLTTAAKTDDGDNRKLVRVGDFAINSRSDRRGSCGISPYDGSVSLINTILIPRKKMHPGYYDWLFHTTLFADEFYKWGHGIVDDLWTTRWQEMKRILVPVPPYETQSAIASYLDTQCAKIDEIIAQAKASIEDYKQWKASIIYEAVTKGLDPNVEMKDSGIEWIGKVPTHWRVAKIKNFVSIRSGITLGKQYPPGTQLVPRPYLRVANVKAEYVDMQDVATIMVTNEEAEKYALKSGELLMTEGGDRDKLGRGTIWHGEIPGCLHQNHVFAVRVNEKYVLTKFLDYLTASPVGREYFDLTAKKTTNLASTNSTTILQFSVPIPPLAEQEKIIAILDRNTATINEVIAEKETLVSDLESYKKSLIYETVTGKRRVTEPTQMTISVLSPDILRYHKALLMLRILDLLGNDARGRIHLQKCMFSAECLLNIPLQTQYVRYEHGPYDLHLTDYEAILCNSGWFHIQEGSPMTYQKGEQFAEGLEKYMNVFSGIDAGLMHIIGFLKPMKTAQAERVATLLATWNDFIIDGKSHPTDEEIINEVMSNWTPNKANPQYSTWQDTLTKMRKKQFVPSGFGTHTLKKEALMQEE